MGMQVHLHDRLHSHEPFFGADYEVCSPEPDGSSKYRLSICDITLSGRAWIIRWAPRRRCRRDGPNRTVITARRVRWRRVTDVGASAIRRHLNGYGYLSANDRGDRVGDGGVAADEFERCARGRGGVQ